MSQKIETKTWTKPELTKLGKLAEVAGSQNTSIQQGNSKS